MWASDSRNPPGMENNDVLINPWPFFQITSHHTDTYTHTPRFKTGVYSLIKPLKHLLVPNCLNGLLDRLV